MNATVGDNGIITKAQKSKFAQKVSSYKEEMQENIIGEIGTDVERAKKITALNDNVKKYITSLDEKDLGLFGIIDSELYYLGEDELETEICKSLGVKLKGEEFSTEDFANEVESKAIESILKNMTGDAFTQTDEEGNESEVGVKLYDKNFANGNKWKIITEVENNNTIATYGNDWYYVECGNAIDGIGILKNNYIINYNIRKAVRFDAHKHTVLAYGANIAVNHNLVLNIDPLNMSSNSTDSWGNVQLYGFTTSGAYNEEGEIISGYDGTSIKLDGIDDEIVFNATEDFSGGFTLSYYGRLLEKSYFRKYCNKLICFIEIFHIL